ncbi:hypothetical protein KFX43_21820 [Bacteroides thetaiotaomicron]|jgi:hypothetical protein|uniref:hypothetical protein n=1 Tax=Bacteroides thetaiotaomicron TaxID=818 RepID=UPI001CE26388|nr:hypothetical protein [Bacteroides thetaiotaomicron]MCA6015225.1 hypothetical protein [Bacteroides thetaiotaomicron]
MDKITSILNLLVGSKEVDFEDVYNKLIEHDPYLTRDELKSIALKENLLSLQVNDEPLKLRRKSDKPVPLPPNQNPSQKR